MLRTGERLCFSPPCACLCRGSDPSQLMPKTGRHEAFHLVGEESQWREECAEKLEREGS